VMTTQPRSHAPRGNASLCRSAASHQAGRRASRKCVPTQSVGTRTVGAIVLVFFAAFPALAAGPRVDIVIGEKAPALEKRAAEDIAADLKKVYDAEVTIATAAPEGAEHVIFVGSPETDEHTRKQIAESWPAINSAQGHVLRTIKFRGKPALFIGGGSSVAAYWGAAEFAHRLGIRTMLYGDLYPVAPKPFTLEGYDVACETIQKERIWSALDPLPTGQTAWGLAEQKSLLRQLARLKYTQIEIGVRPWQPFVHFEYGGVKKETGVLWYGWQFAVGGDTAGRSAFKGSKTFENPDFVGATTYGQRIAAGQKLIRGIVDEAHTLGIKVTLYTNPFRVPKDFDFLLPRSQPVSEPLELSIEQSGGDSKLNDEKLIRLSAVQSQAYKDAYPRLDGVTYGPDSSIKPLVLVEDRDFNTYFESRKAFDASVTRALACQDFVTSVCGEGVADSVIKAHQQLEVANSIADAPAPDPRPDPRFSAIASNMIMKHYGIGEPPPWWSKVRDNYLGAMNDMYRANSRAREGGRSYTLYLARRCEFGYEYMNCVEATRKAGIARDKKDTAEQRAQLEKAIESMNAACSALAAVARDQSDRGMIAVCNEFGYKALQKELEKLDGEEGK
jgi:hypothetical protein